MNPRSVRVRMTALVMIVTALVTLLAAMVGVGRIEETLTLPAATEPTNCPSRQLPKRTVHDTKGTHGEIGSRRN